MGLLLGEVNSGIRAVESLRYPLPAVWQQTYSDILNMRLYSSADIVGEEKGVRLNEMWPRDVKREREQERYNKWHTDWSHVIAKELLQ